MTFDKETIKRSFTRAASTYDEYAGLQKDVADEVGARLLAIARKMAPACASPGGCGEAGVRSSFLDIGCGTGRLASRVASSLPGARVYASDIALTMLYNASEIHGNSISLTVADFSALPFMDASFDAAGSSLAFQWATDLKAALTEAARVLRPGGALVFSTLGPRTLWELRECYKAGKELGFIDEASVEATVRAAGLEVISIEARRITRVYDGFNGLLRALKMIGAAPPGASGSRGLSPGKALKEAGRLYSERYGYPSGGVVATYEVVFIEARKV